MSIANEIRRIRAAKAALKSAINAKGGTLTGEILDDYAPAVLNISTGADVSQVTVTAGDILAGKTAVASDGQLITGTISTAVPVQNGNTVDIPAGYLAENYSFTVESGGTDTSDATVSADKLLAGVTAYGASGKVTGTIETVLPAVSGNTVEIPAGFISTEQRLTIPLAAEAQIAGNTVTLFKGYQASEKVITIGTTHPGGVFVPGTGDQEIASDTFLSGSITLKGDKNLLSGNIRSGVTLFGVTGSYGGSVIMGSMEFYKCAALDTGTRTWSGYKAVLTDGAYSFSEILTENLSYGTGFTPNSGKIYNNDATVYIFGLWSGLPSDGLVFYAPLSSNASATETGQSLLPHSGEVAYTTANGIPCALFDGSSVLAAGTDNLPYSNSPFTLSFFMRPTSSPSVDTGVFAFGKDSNGSLISVVCSSGVIALASHGGGWGQGSPAQINWDNTMKHIAFVVGQGDIDNRPLSVYINGAKVTDTYLRMSGFASDFEMYIGSYWGDADYIPNFTGYLSSLRIYNRVLSDDEIKALAGEFDV